MAGSIAQRAGEPPAKSAAVSLSIILDKKQAIAPAYLRNTVIIRTLAVKMHYHHGPRTPGYNFLNPIGVKLQGVRVRFHQNRRQIILAYRQNGCDISIGRNNNLIAEVQCPELDIGAKYQLQGIKPVSAPYGKARTYIVCILPLKSLIFCTRKIPARIDSPADGVGYFPTMGGIYFLQIKKLYHPYR